VPVAALPGVPPVAAAEGGAGAGWGCCTEAVPCWAVVARLRSAIQGPLAEVYRSEMTTKRSPNWRHMSMR